MRNTLGLMPMAALSVSIETVLNCGIQNLDRQSPQSGSIPTII
jgi:hypothetical protein